MTARDPNTRPDFTQMYNLSVQRQLGGKVVLEVGFMGSRSSRILMDDPINNAVPALPNDTSSAQSRRRVINLLGAFSYLISARIFELQRAGCQPRKALLPGAEHPCQLHLVTRARRSSRDDRRNQRPGDSGSHEPRA